MGPMKISACDECIKRASFDANQCQQCPLFLLLGTESREANPLPDVEPVGKLRPLLILGISVVSAGICAAMFDLALVAGTLVTFGIGTCLADCLINH